jgi:hypothetical protein
MQSRSSTAYFRVFATILTGLLGLEVCFTQRVNQPVPRSDVIRDVRE